jgi:hypothetical protein
MNLADPSVPWIDLTPAQRNNRIGELIQAKPLAQLYLAVDGKFFSWHHLEVDRIEELRTWVTEWQSTEREFKKWIKSAPSIREEWRGKITVEVDHWHIRYSETAGGGWDVILALRAKGVGIQVSSSGDQWMLVGLAAQGSATHVVKAATMQEAACLLATEMLTAA